MVFGVYTVEQVDIYLKQIVAYLRQDKPKEYIAEQLNLEKFDELFSMAKAKYSNEKSNLDFYMTETDLRFATNELAANWRAKRLACDTLVEVGSGIGIQTLAFAKTCKKVIAIEIDPRKVSYSKATAKKQNITNVEFICGDGIEELKKLDKADVVFMDPERAPNEEQRDLATIKPDVHEIIKQAKRLTDKIAIELPPQLYKIDFDCEKEYLSIDQKLNRLTVYLGDLKKAERSAVILPEEVFVSHSAEKTVQRSPPLQYIYEINPAVAKAELLSELLDDSMFLYQTEKEVMLTSSELKKSPFFKAVFAVKDATRSRFNDIMSSLERRKAGKVILRQNLDPKDYWTERQRYENRLRGNRTFTLFVNKKHALVCERL